MVDETGTLRDALKLAKQLAGLDADEKATLKILPKQQNPLEAILGADLDKQREVRLLSGIAQLLPELSGRCNTCSSSAKYARTCDIDDAILLDVK